MLDFLAMVLAVLFLLVQLFWGERVFFALVLILYCLNDIGKKLP